MNYEILIEEVRNKHVENVHIGMISIVNERGERVATVGDDEHMTYFRSAAKPIQAIPVFSSTIIEKYGLTEREVALFTASHRGETYHIEALESMLAKLPVEEEELYCPRSYPLNRKPREAMIRDGKEQRRLYHNCAGKHLGFLALCHERGYPTEGYWRADHPLQQEIIGILSMLAEVPVQQIELGIDGCGVPVFALPLRRMAFVFLKLACPDIIEDDALRSAVQKMTQVMNRQYNMVASERFICSLLLQDTNIVAKGGAQGVYCLGLKKERVGIALKVLNGSEDVWPNVVASILEQIGYENKKTIQALRDLRPSTLTNDSGHEVGRIRETFSLDPQLPSS